MQSVEEALKEFHTTFDLPVEDKPVVSQGDNEREWESVADTWELRMELHREEYKELKQAMRDGILVNIADAICDLVYVAVGTAVSFGIPFDKCFAEVQRSNMSKLGEDGKPIVREDGKILK